MLEELKLVLDVLSRAGEGAYWVGLLWVAKGYFTSLLGFGLGFFLVAALYRVIIAAVSKCSFTSQVQSVIEQDMEYSRNRIAVLNFLREHKNEINIGRF